MNNKLSPEKVQEIADMAKKFCGDDPWVLTRTKAFIKGATLEAEKSADLLAAKDAEISDLIRALKTSNDAYKSLISEKKGMQWVKVVDRLPLKVGYYAIKYHYGLGGATRGTEVKYETTWFDGERFVGNWKPFPIEWLDESAPLPDAKQEAVAEENKFNGIICLECNVREAAGDYNGHGHYVCQLCMDSLSREFDNDYN